MTIRGQIQLKACTINIESLNQRNIYAGLLEGLPTRERNTGIISDTLSQLRQTGGEPYLVPPAEKPIPYHLGKYPFGEPAALPHIVCIASCHSLFSSQDSPLYASHLTVVWFQDDYAFPIDPLVLEHLQALDWKRHAIEYEI